MRNVFHFVLAFFVLCNAQHVARAAEKRQTDSKSSNVLELLPAVRQEIRHWNADGVLVDLRCEPSADGTVDLTAPGGNLLCMAYSPSKRTGATIAFNAAGQATLTPSDRPTTPCVYAIPSNIVDLSDALAAARKEGLAGHPSRVELNGSGDDANLRQFCWMIMGETRPFCVDAMFGYSTSYKEFNNCRQRSEMIPFTANTGFNHFITRRAGNIDNQMYWCRDHAVYLDGVEQAIKVEIPWQLITPDDMRKHSHLENGETVYEAGSKVYPLGDFAPLTPEAQRRFLLNEDAVAIDCVPGVVLVEGYRRMSNEMKTRVKRQLNSANRR